MAVSDAAINDPGLIINKAMAGEVPSFYVTLDKFTRIRFLFTYDQQDGSNGFWFIIEYMDQNGVWHEGGTERIESPAGWLELLALPA